MIILATCSPGAAWAVPDALADDAADLCSRFGVVEATGTVASPELVELSGLAASRAHPGVVWAHNDSGDTARLFAVDTSGRDLGTYTVSGARAVDWEDIAVGPGEAPGTSALYIADIGDNRSERVDGVTIYRVPEPDAAPDGTGGSLSGTAAVTLVSPRGPDDAEALLVDPATGDLVIITKSLAGESHVLTADAPVWTTAPADAPMVMVDAGTIHVQADFGLPGLPGSMVTAADVAPDGSFILVRTYQYILAFPRGVDQTLVQALLGTPCFAPAPLEPQGEALAISASGDAYLTASEVQRPIDIGDLPAGSAAVIRRVRIDPPPSTPTTATTTAATATATTTPASGTTSTSTSTLGERTSTSTGAWLWIIAGFMLVVASGVGWWRIRRHRSVRTTR